MSESDEVHPLLRHRGFVLKTPPLVELMRDFDQLRAAGELGMVCYAPPRTGKTTAAAFIAARRKNDSVIVSSRLERQQISSRIAKHEFWNGFNANLDGRLLSGGSSFVYSVLINEIRTRAADGDLQKVVVVLDEAQYLVPQHLAMLKRFVDELIDARLVPFVVLFGTPAIRNHVTELGHLGMHDILDRFYVHMRELRGIRPSEFESVLGQYDKPFPGRRQPFSQDFAPALFERGWRLANDAKVFREEFLKLNRLLGGPAEPVFEAKFVTTAVRLYLVQLKEEGGALETPSRWIEKSVARCGLRESRVLVAKVPSEAPARRSRRKSD